MATVHERLLGWSCDCPDGKCARCRQGDVITTLAEAAQESAERAETDRRQLAAALRSTYGDGANGWTLEDLTGATHLSLSQVHRIVSGLSGR